jgi:malonyl-CoA/methylmalonyl-CoA synthetase
MDLTHCLREAAHSQPHHLFLRTPSGQELTYGQLLEHSQRFAAGLAQLGVMPGDRVAVQVEKSVEAILLYAACLSMGAVFVPINIANTPHEVEYFFRDARPKIAVVDPKQRAALLNCARDAGVAHLETLGAAGDGSLLELVRRCEARNTGEPSLLPQDLAAIVYTSGTTGRSKGAMLTRGNLASNAAVLAEAWQFTASDVVLHVLPLFHIHGLFVAINTALASGAGILLMTRFDGGETIKHLNECSVFMGVPTHYTRLLQHSNLGRDSTARIRLFVSGSAPLLAETHMQFLERTGHVILERYGMSETLINTSNPYEGVRRPGSVGPPLPGIQVRVADTAAGESIGALEIKGPNVFAGYWQDDAKTQAEFTADGWFKSGDLGHIDSQGYVHIVGRAKDLVITGGYNVYPKEVESELDALTGILESAVFGVPHPDFGEGVTAAVVIELNAALSESQIIERVQSRLARYKVPKRVLLVDELPRNTMGKVQKNELRKRFASLYEIP